MTTTKRLHRALILTILVLGNPFVLQSSDSCVASSDFRDFDDFFCVVVSSIGMMLVSWAIQKATKGQ